MNTQTDILSNGHTESPVKIDIIPMWLSHCPHNACNDYLVEAHDVLVERVSDDVRGEVGVRRELLLEQLVVLAKDHLKSTVILLSHPFNVSYVIYPQIIG